MTTHLEARECAREALVKVLGSASLGAERALCGVAALETGYGNGWRGVGKGSFNMGAIQAGSSWKGEVFTYTDTHPNADGSSTPYQIAFRKYPNAEAGWEDLVRVVYVNRGRGIVLTSADAGDLLGVSTGLYRTGYYEGFGPTKESRIQNHFAALLRNVRAADAVVASAGRGTRKPTLRLHSGYDGGEERDDVRELQRALGLVADGLFGPRTAAAVRAYQLTSGLTPDGVVGPKTWAALAEDAR